jgi:hypothetical protein
MRRFLLNVTAADKIVDAVTQLVSPLIKSGGKTKDETSITTLNCNREVGMGFDLSIFRNNMGQQTSGNHTGVVENGQLQAEYVEWLIEERWTAIPGTL